MTTSRTPIAELVQPDSGQVIFTTHPPQHQLHNEAARNTGSTKVATLQIVREAGTRRETCVDRRPARFRGIFDSPSCCSQRQEQIAAAGRSSICRRWKAIRSALWNTSSSWRRMPLEFRAHDQATVLIETILATSSSKKSSMSCASTARLNAGPGYISPASRNQAQQEFCWPIAAPSHGSAFMRSYALRW